MPLPGLGRWTLLRKFTVLSLVCFAALGIALSQLLAHQIRHRALSRRRAAGRAPPRHAARGLCAAAVRISARTARGRLRDLHAVRAGGRRRGARRPLRLRARGRRADAALPAPLPDRGPGFALAAPPGRGEPAPGAARPAYRPAEQALSVRAARQAARAGAPAVAARGRPRRLQGA